jgi:uncharacterized protein (UPF0276 family)
MNIGVGFRPELARWIASLPVGMDCLEITAEHFFDAPDAAVERLAAEYPLLVHGLGLSLGTRGPLDKNTLNDLERVVRLARPRWVSEHVAFTRGAGVDFGHLNPVSPDEQTLATLVDHARELRDRVGCDVLLENIASFVRLDGPIPETEFLNRLCEKSGCGLLLDVTNLYVNARNHRFDPFAWLNAIDARHVRQLHVVGYAEERGVWHDRHADPIQDALWPLIHEAIAHARPDAIILERDWNFGDVSSIAREVQVLKEHSCAA